MVAFSFQFHKGTIRTDMNAIYNDPEKCFNSIKVRLEHAATLVTAAKLKFQFHKGTIRT